MNTIKQSKIPEIVLAVRKQLGEGEIEVAKIEIYLNFLAELTEKECYYLKNNHSNVLFDNDLEFCVDTIVMALKPYEELEEYEFCKKLLDATVRYNAYLTSR